MISLLLSSRMIASEIHAYRVIGYELISLVDSMRYPFPVLIDLHLESIEGER